MEAIGRRRWWVLGLFWILMPHAVTATSPLAWSPDGEWLCYVTDEVEKPRPLPTSWIFAPPVDSDTTRPKPRLAAEPDGPRVSRLWATKVATKASILLDTTAGAITSPAWNPDGHSIVFGRSIPTTPGRGHFEIVHVEGPNRRVLLDQPIEAWTLDASRLVRSTFAWSPDGRFLAVPLLKPAGLAILRTDTGRIIKTLEGGAYPVWVPDGSKLLYISSGDEDRLECLESHFGASRHLADLGQVDGPPLISRDGISLVLLTRKRIDRGATPPGEQVDLWRVRIEDGRKERLAPFGTTTKDQVLAATSLTQDRDGENLLSTLTIDGQPSYVSWFRPRERSVYKKFPVLDTTLRLDDLSLSPAGGTLALRIGSAGKPGLPALCDLDSMQLTPITPNLATRTAWIARILACVEALIPEITPGPVVAGRAIDRGVVLPIPGEIDTNSEPMLRLRRLGRIGHALSVENGATKVDDARFLFDYIREDYPAALLDLESLESGATDPERRLRILGYSAQVFVGLGDFDRARGTFAYLKSIEPSRTRRAIETTSEGISVSTVAPRDSGWADYALHKLDAIEREATAESKEGPISPTDHRNFDAPQPGFGLELLPPPGIVVPRGFLRPVPRRPEAPPLRPF